MTDSTPPEQAGGEAAGVPCHYTTARPPPPIRLQLEVGEPLLRLTRFMRSAVAQSPRAAEKKEYQKREPPKNKGRRTLRRVAVRSLLLGQRKFASSTDEFDIAAKFLYNKPRKIVCQMIRRGDGLLRIDILWSNIQAMSASFNGASFDTLRIETKSSSEQYRAKPPPPRMHLQWQREEDITTRTFCLQFDKGTLERSYGKMLYTDPSLMLLPLPTPPPGGDEEESEGSTDAPQTVAMIPGAAAPITTSVDDFEAEMPGTRMLGSTNTGANVATHEYSGAQSNDPCQPAHMHPLYRWM